MATRTVASGGGNWDSTGTWVESVVPVAQDDVVFNSSSGNVTMNVDGPHLKSLDMTGYAGTLTFTNGAGYMYISPTSGSTNAKFAGTIVLNNQYIFTDASTGCTIKLYFSGTFSGGGEFGIGRLGFEGATQLQTDMNLGSSVEIYQSESGSHLARFYSNNHTVTAKRYTLLGYSVWGSSAVVHGSSSGGLLSGYNTNIDGGSATFNNFQGSFNGFGDSNCVFGTVNIIGSCSFEGNPTFGTLNLNGGTYHTFIHGNTYTITTDLTATGGGTMHVLSDSSGNHFTFSKTTGAVNITGVLLKDCYGSGGATWNDSGGTDVSGNSGWTFVGIYSKSLSDSISASDAIQKGTGKLLTDTDALTDGYLYRKSLSDSIALSETFIANKQLTMSFSDSFLLADSLIYTGSYWTELTPDTAIWSE